MQNIFFIIGLMAFLATTTVFAADTTNVNLSIKDHKFTPAEIKVPAGKPIVLHVKNMDARAEEFDSHDLKAEKVISGNSEAIIRVRALKAGRYEFEGEYNSKTAQGVLIAE